MEAENLKNYYFTFGSAEHFPYQNGYIVVKANTEQEAIQEFRQHFPDYHEGTVNCAFWYNEKQWENSDNKKFYKEPYETISFGDFDKIVQRRSKNMTVEDVKDLKYLGSESFDSGHTTAYYFDCTINDEAQKLDYEVSVHDRDEESFTIHTSGKDVWEYMSEAELTKLDYKLCMEVIRSRYAERIMAATDLDTLKAIEYEVTDDDRISASIISELYRMIETSYTRLENMEMAERNSDEISEDEIEADNEDIGIGFDD